MNYKLLFSIVLSLCLFTLVKADTVSTPDYSSNGYNMSINGTIVDGKINNAFNFTRLIGTFGNVTYKNGLGITTYPFTFQAWVKTPSIPTVGEMTIMAFNINQSGLPTGVDYSFGVATSGNLFILARNDTLSDTGTSTQKINDSTFHHVVAVFNNSTSRVLYYDGNAILNRTVLVGFNNTRLEFGIGATVGVGEGNFFNGTIDEVGVWSRALNLSEVRALYNSGNGLAFNSSGITWNNVGYWKLDGIGNPTMTLNSPSDSTNFYETDYRNISFNVSGTSSIGYNLTNISLYTNLSGSWALNSTISLSGLNNATVIFNETLPLGGNVLWGINVCDNSGVCLASSNRTLIFQNITFGLCNDTLTTQFVNISFKDENSLTPINASITTSTFTYYLGNGLVNKTLTFSDTNLNYNYTFCAIPTDRNFYVAPTVQYKQGTSYPQRVWQPTIRTYNSTLTSQTLYLLNTNDGIYVTYQVLDNTGTQVSDVSVTATRSIESQTVVVGTGNTDDAGIVTFWMNPDFLHTVTFEKSGYETFTLNQFPTQSTYTVTLGSSTGGIINDYLRGISYTIRPVLGTTLNSSTTYNFNLTLNSSYWNLSSFGFNLYGDNVLISANSSSSSNGGFISVLADTSSYSHLKINYYWIINGTVTNATSGGWFIFNYNNGTNWSISNFFDDLSTYADQGIFGLNQNALNLIIFFVIFIATGIMSYKFGYTSPAVVSGIVFALVFIFDFGLGLINIGVGIDHLPTIFTGLVMVSLIIREVTT